MVLLSMAGSLRRWVNKFITRYGHFFHTMMVDRGALDDFVDF